MEDQDHLAVNGEPMLAHGDVMVDFGIGVQHREEVVLDFVRRLDAGDLEGAVTLCDAENEMPAVCVRKGGNRVVGGSGNARAGLFELDIVPLASRKELLQFSLVHRLDLPRFGHLLLRNPHPARFNGGRDGPGNGLALAERSDQ